MATVVLYEHANFEGEHIVFNTADDNLTNNALRWFGPIQLESWNDQVSSMVIGGDDLIVYEHVNFSEAGVVQRFEEGAYAYVGDFWNDRISSFQFDPFN